MIVTSSENPMWFIISKGEEVQYGEILPGFTTESIYPIHTYGSEDKWKSELLKLGVNIDDIRKAAMPSEPPVEPEPASVKEKIAEIFKLK